MAFLPIAPNWSASVRTTYEFKTDVFESHDGTEQRVAQRQTPRRTNAFRSLLRADRYRELDAILRRIPVAWHTAADVGRPDAPALASNGLPATSGTLTVSIVGTAPPWLTAGAAVALVDGYHVERLVVAGVSGSTVSFTSALLHSYAPGGRVYPIASVSVGDGPVFSGVTDGMAEVEWNLLVQPGADLPAYGAPSMEWDDREMWLQRPNWAAPPTMTFLQPTRTIDYGYGRIARHAPVPIGGRVTQQSVRLKGRQAVADLVAFFGRCRGRRGEFYAPTWMSDMALELPLADGASSMRVTAPRLSERHPDLEVYRDILIDTRSQGMLVRRVTGMVGGATGSTLTLQTTLPALQPADVAMISWLPLCRHASDMLTIEWVTDTEARAIVSPQAIRNA